MKSTASVALAATISIPSASKAQPALISGVDHVGINVPDLKQAEQFFSEVFGFTAVTQLGPIPLNDGWKDLTGMEASTKEVTIKMFHAGTGASIEMFEYSPNPKNEKQPGADNIGASHIAFYTPDITVAVKYLRSKGVKVLTDPFVTTEGPTAGESWVYFETPWGSRLELVSYPNGKAYEKENASVRLWSPKQGASSKGKKGSEEPLSDKQIQDLVSGHLAIWNEKDPEKRSSSINRIYAADIEMVDRHFILQGQQSVNDFVTKLQTLHPDYRFQDAEPVNAHHNIIRLHWQFGNKEKPDAIAGMDLFVAEDGKVKKLYVFVDKEG